ncbi:MAG: NACHT domain-containing protein [Symploca sp. SIO3E6]|nr:NACHT domain-containing protein [Caldora sp. SIO3E6]
MGQNYSKKVLAHNYLPAKGIPLPLNTPKAKRGASQTKLLQFLITEVEERLAQSLHNAVWLTLGMEQQNYRVERPHCATVVQPSQSPEPLAAGTRIVEVFNRREIKRQLLILGEPGAGKTTMMLELAEDLLRQAVADKTEPIPVLLNLSSWKNPQQSIFDWLLGELNEKYGIRQDVARQWLGENQILPLLDGLDEVAPQHQKACAEKLNDWLIAELEQRPCSVLICCRREEFEQGVQQPLSLYGAIYLQPLTIEQIEDYFTQFNLQDVWQTVQQSKVLQEILTTPLFLSMFGLVQAHGKFSLSDWESGATSMHKIKYLLDTYWEATMSRELITNPREKRQGIGSKTYGKKPVPTRRAVLRALVFTAKMLRRESSTELLIEKMQPTVLTIRRQKRAYRLIIALIGGLNSGMTFGLIFGLILGMNWGLIERLIGALIVALIIGLIALIIGLIIGLIGVPIPGLKTIEPLEEIAISMSHEGLRKILRALGTGLISGLVIGLIGALIIGLIGGLIVWLLSGLMIEVLIIGLIYGSIIGLIGGLTVGLTLMPGAVLIGRLKADIQTRIKPNQGIKNAVKNTVILSGIALVIALPFKFILEYLLSHIFDSEVLLRAVGITVTVLIWSGFVQTGVGALIQHIALRIILAWNCYAPLRYDLLLNYCTERLLLQRVGGRYRFMHKFLQDHFARMDLK